MTETSGPAILAVNGGSSTVKLDRFGVAGEAPHHIGHRTIEIGTSDRAALLRGFAAETTFQPDAVVHRIVHGGHEVTGPAFADAAVEAAIEAAVPLAPLHNPRGLAWLAAARAAFPEARQIVVPDTGFFAELPGHVTRYALPRGLADELGIRRFGFHGIAHQSMLRRWAAGRGGVKDGRVISLQLGSGCSVAAIRDGHPMETSMGFTPLEGLVMATRSGDVDPGLVIYLMRERGMSAEALDHLLNNESGLLGLGGSGDMRALLEAGTREADEAIAVFCHRIRKYLGAYLAVLGGADAILFGGGIGEHAATIRARVLDGMDWAGIAVDADANNSASGRTARFDAPASATELHVIEVDEAEEMARLALPLLR